MWRRAGEAGIPMYSCFVMILVVGEDQGSSNLQENAQMYVLHVTLVSNLDQVPLSAPGHKVVGSFGAGGVSRSNGAAHNL